MGLCRVLEGLRGGLLPKTIIHVCVLGMLCDERGILCFG